MQSAVVIKGRLVGPKSVELEEPVADLESEVEVIVRPGVVSTPDQGRALAEFLRVLPPGTRSREQIDQQLQEERSAWE